MSDKPHLLMLPTEIRYHIYSFIYLEHRIVDFLRPKSYYPKTGLFLSCHQLHQETLEYYFGRNTFSLPLCRRFAMSDWRFMPRHFNLVKMLHLEANTFFWKSSSNSAKVAEHTENCQRRLRKYLKAIFWANQGILAPILKTLTFADRVPTNHDQFYWDRNTDTSKERLEAYVQVFEDLHVRVGQVVVKINRGDFRETEDGSDMFDLHLN